MKGLILIILVSMVVSFLSRGKKDASAQQSTNKKRIFADWAEDISSKTNNVKYEENGTQENLSNYSEKRTDKPNKVVKNNVDREENKKKSFDLKRAVIYSTILDRPYNY